jgi:signal transduction histidine kinase
MLGRLSGARWHGSRRAQGDKPQPQWSDDAAWLRALPLEAHLERLNGCFTIRLPLRAEHIAVEKRTVRSVHADPADRRRKFVEPPEERVIDRVQTPELGQNSHVQKLRRGATRIRLGRQASGPFRPPFALLALGAAGLVLLAFQPVAPSCDPLVLTALAVAAMVLAPLPIRLPGEVWPTSLLPLVLIPTFLLCGGWPVAALAVTSVLFASLLGRRVRLHITWQLAASLVGIGSGALVASAFAAGLPPGVAAEAGRAIVFGLALWAGQCAAEWLHLERKAAITSWLLGLLTNLLLLAPGFFLAQLGSGEDPLLFAAGLGLAVVFVSLVRASTNSETRTVELAAQAASSADARHHLELIVDHAPEAIFGMDAQGTVRWLNRTAGEWLGETADELIGRPASAAVPVRTVTGGQLDHAALLRRASDEGRPLHEEGLLEGVAGAPERVVVSYGPADPSSGDLGLVLLRDADVVPESLREQEDLAVHLSHELRAPLTTILGYAQMMANPSGNDLVPNAQEVFAKRISESGDYMLRLVNNLLDLGRLARGDEPGLPLARADVVALTREVVEAHRPQADTKAQTLTFEGPSGPIFLVTSDLALRQMLTNLVANAIKYTPPNGHVRVKMSDGPESTIWQVIDDGIGLSPEEQSRVFTRFFRSQRPEARLIKGTGLGLALSKALAERLGGSIEVQSALDKGSTFTVQLPHQVPAPTSRVRSQRPPDQGLEV